MDDLLVRFGGRAFDLAYFIHRDRSIAMAIMVDALSRVEALASTQAKRRYYRPKARSRAELTRAQQLQRLVYVCSEPYERRQEEAGSDGDPSEDDWTVRFTAYLTRRCLRRNAFHVAVGFGRLLYGYTTQEVLALFDLVAQDSECLKSSDYARARKKVLMDEIRQRYEPHLNIRLGPRGEEIFEPRSVDDHLVHLMEICLKRMTPWQSACPVPETFRATQDTLTALQPRSGGDEGDIEIRRIHALIHPRCLKRLIRSLKMSRPSERLQVPRLSAGSKPRDLDRDPPTPFSDSDRETVQAELERRRELRRRVLAGVFRIKLDGREIGFWNADPSEPYRLTLDEDHELVEVFGEAEGREILLAAYLVPDRDSLYPDSPVESTNRLTEGTLKGSRFVFRTTLEPDRLRCDLGFELGLRARWAASPKWHRPVGLKAATALVALSLGAIVWLHRPAPHVDPPRLRNVVESPVALHEVRSVFLDPSAEVLRGSLIEHLAVSPRFVLKSEPGTAEARLVLDRDAARLRLVDRNGRVLWTSPFTEPLDSDELAARLLDAVTTEAPPLSR